jgi:hypothetical protein
LWCGVAGWSDGRLGVSAPEGPPVSQLSRPDGSSWTRSRPGVIGERRTLVSIEGSSAVAVGIDAAVVANHHVVVRRAVAGGPGEKLEQFVVAPTLSGLSTLTKRLAAYPGALAVAEPTSMT